MTSVAEAPTKREGFGSRALSAVSFQRTAFRCYFCKESIRCQSTAQVDNTEHCYHTRLGKSKARFLGFTISLGRLLRREIVPPLFRIRFSKGGGMRF